MIRYEVIDRHDLNGNKIFITAFQVTNILPIEEYYRQVKNPVAKDTNVIVLPTGEYAAYILNPVRSSANEAIQELYDYVELDSGERVLLRKEKGKFLIPGMYVMYNVGQDDYQLFDVFNAQINPRLKQCA